MELKMNWQKKNLAGITLSEKEAKGSSRNVKMLFF